ncbi:LPD1 domain-containing protein [Cohnella soli]|uniref:LPD1 domain-containing protein n=1 Tax=Cohnella soli TaxID=425005 RepID=A0ABW0HQ47_9BACL
MAVEQLEFSLFDYFPAVFAGHTAPAPVVTEIEKDETVASRKLYSYDVGEELWGARKHFASLLKFSPERYAALEKDPTQAFEAICKDELFGALPVDELRERGFASEVAFAIKQIWDRVVQRPEDSAKAREHYVLAIAELKGVFSDTLTVTAFDTAFFALKDSVKKATNSESSRLVQKDPSLLDHAFWLSLGDRFRNFFLGKARRDAGYISVFKRAFHSDEAKGWKWTEPKARNTTKSSSRERWERRVPTEVIRLSKEPSGVEKPEDFLEHYGYRGVQFGHWMEDAAGRYHVLCCGNANADLAMILNLPRHAISFYGRLGLAFGARGSGKASAHFEPNTNVFNLTKMNGGGALCHEWAHALDYNLNSFAHGFGNGKIAALSGSDAGPQLPHNVAYAFKRIMERIKKGNGKLRYVVPSELPSTKGNFRRSVISSVLKRCDYDVSEALMSIKDSYRVKQNLWADVGITCCYIIKDAGREVPTEFFIPTDFSAFFLDAKDRGEYWRRDHELFARAFEAWVEDELADCGMTNSYLVSGTRSEGPYPQGSERIAINEAFRWWWKELLDSNILEDEQTWRRDR